MVQLIINGEIAELKEVLKDLIDDAVKEAMAVSGAPVFSPEFTLEPDKLYSLSDERIQRMFGVEKLAHPVKSILYNLRKNGVSPITTKRHGAAVFGRNITEYYAALRSAEITNTILKN